jgi:hypothetical protein
MNRAVPARNTSDTSYSKHVEDIVIFMPFLFQLSMHTSGAWSILMFVFGWKLNTRVVIVHRD